MADGRQTAPRTPRESTAQVRQLVERAQAGEREALEGDTPVGRFLAKRGPGMHHVAYEVDDLPGTLADLAEDGAELIDERPRRGLFGLEVAFVHPDSVHGVLSEVVAHG